MLAGWLVSSWAAAQDETGCDGDQQKGVVVPCAGIEFCTCAEPCTANSECQSDCCQNSVCVPKCACEGGGYSMCKVGEYPSDARDSESGGCSVKPSTSGEHAGGGVAILVIAGLLACSRSRRDEGGQHRARS